MGKAPSFQYYPKDWQADPIFACSLAARGLWHEMMNVMHGCEPYGYLAENDKPMPVERIARKCGTTPQEFNELLSELDEAGVPRRTASGIIFCKRMVEDERKRREWRKRQKKHRHTEEECHSDVTRYVTRYVTPMSQRSSSPSPSPSLKQKSKPKASGWLFESLPEWIDKQTWQDFEEMRRRIRVPMTDRARRDTVSDLEKLRKAGHEANAVLAQSIKLGWRGVFELRSDGGRNGNNAGNRKVQGFHGEPSREWAPATPIVTVPNQ